MGEERSDVFHSLLGEMDNKKDKKDLSLKFQRSTKDLLVQDLCALAFEVHNKSWLTKIGR